MDDNRSSRQFYLPGIVVVLLVPGVLVFTDTPSKPTRPEAPSELTFTVEDMLSRLWQGPFEDVDMHRKRVGFFNFSVFEYRG